MPTTHKFIETPPYFFAHSFAWHNANILLCDMDVWGSNIWIVVF